MTMPPRTTEQRMHALDQANHVRQCRAALKGEVKGGARQVAEVLAAPPEYARGMKVAELLLAVPGYGQVKVTKLMGECDIADSKTVGGLTERQARSLTARTRRATVGRVY